MSHEQYVNDNADLMQIENLSKQISDLINKGDFSRIENLDKIRFNLIKNFKDKNMLKRSYSYSSLNRFLNSFFKYKFKLKNKILNIKI